LTRIARTLGDVELDMRILAGKRPTCIILSAVRLISLNRHSVTSACEMTDELERIRARKIAEMAERTRVRENPPRARSPMELNDGNFESTIRSNELVAVDCWAAWCYPCRMIAPIVEELAAQYGSKALFAKLNVDDNPATAIKYSIQSIPTILIIKDGVEVERIIGAHPKQQIEAVLRKYVS
jgi:thioredoxin